MTLTLTMTPTPTIRSRMEHHPLMGFDISTRRPRNLEANPDHDLTMN